MKKTNSILLGTARRKPIKVSPEVLVKTGFLDEERELPLVIEPVMRGVNLAVWAKDNLEYIETSLLKHGAILFRNFNGGEVGQFGELLRAVSTELLEYKERSSPRSEVSDNIYTSTDYPADQVIFLHNENSYQDTWPLRVFFFCAVAPEQGGETPIADCRKIFARLRPQVRERFMEKRWMYVRNFGDGFGLPWQTVFQTSDKSVLEEHCRNHSIEVEWKDEQRLRTRAIRSAVARHPRSGEWTWFNHATFFNVTTLDPKIGESLRAVFSDEDLPTNTFYGDGSPIEPEVLDELREAYRQETVSFPWQVGDILMLDNMLVAHGRAPYKGDRKILVGMAEPCNQRGA